jgi:hypothetical protein
VLVIAAKLEIRNNAQMFEEKKIRNTKLLFRSFDSRMPFARALSLAHLTIYPPASQLGVFRLLVIRICFGFRNSSFGFSRALQLRFLCGLLLDLLQRNFDHEQEHEHDYERRTRAVAASLCRGVGSERRQSAVPTVIPERHVVPQSTIRSSSNPPALGAARLSDRPGDIGPATGLAAPAPAPRAKANTDRAKTRGP